MTNNHIIRQFEFFNEISENLDLCSQKILNIYEKYDQNIEYKDDKSPLTEADLASHEHISDLLSSILFDLTLTHSLPLRLSFANKNLLLFNSTYWINKISDLCFSNFFIKSS